MVIAAWVIGIVIFALSIISIWGTFFLFFLIICGCLYFEFDLSYLREQDFEMLCMALFGPWVLVVVLTTLGGIMEFGEDVRKAVKNLANEDRNRY